MNEKLVPLVPEIHQELKSIALKEKKSLKQKVHEILISNLSDKNPLSRVKELKRLKKDELSQEENL